MSVGLLLFLAQDTALLQLPVQEFTLDNGMRVLSVERRGVPREYCALYWRVGSVNERTGLTGLSHFFEHMMFKGTARIGTKDAQRDAEINAGIESLMQEVRRKKLEDLEANRHGEPPRGIPEELMRRYQELVREQKQITISEHLSRIYQTQGGRGLNASTSYDRTNYYVDLPSNRVELFFWLESDRFSRPVFREFYPERDVVKEERRLRTESTPTGLLHEAFSAMFWEAHPYHWPVIGWMSDIDQYSLADAEAYFARHYSPQNCTAIFVGGVSGEEIQALARKYFGRLQRFSQDPDPIVTQEPPQLAEKAMTAEIDAQPSVSVYWHGPSGVHKDATGLDLLAMILDGRTGRLYRDLVEERKLCLQTSAGFDGRRYGGIFHIRVSPTLKAKIEEIPPSIEQIVQKIRAEGITEQELEKVKKRTIATLARERLELAGISYQLGYYEVIGTWRDFDSQVKRLETITREELAQLCRQYLRPTGRNTLIITRRAR